MFIHLSTHFVYSKRVRGVFVPITPPKQIDIMKGKLLVAMPFVHEQHMSQTVIYLCGHDAFGSIGIILNRVFPTLTFSDLLKQLHIHTTKDCRDLVLHYGGNVETTRGFVLHSLDVQVESSVIISSRVALTSTVDMLKQLAKGNGPQDVFVSLGYTAWKPGKLEEEINDNRWIIVKNPPHEVIFQSCVDATWHQALAHVGVNPRMLSLESGKA